MKRHFIFTLALLLAGLLHSNGQSVSISAISSGGGYTVSPSGSVACTFGQMVFQTAEDPTGILTQGFQQTGCNPAGTPCDDGDPCTVNDVEDGICNCAGTPAPNTDPVADAGGAYTINTMTDLLLDGSSSYDPDEACGDAITNWDWDIDNDGVFDDASGETATILWSDLNNMGISAPGTYTIALRVTDGYGATNSVAVTLTIIDAAVPTLGQWGLIIFGLLLLCAGSIVIWKREYGWEPVPAI